MYNKPITQRVAAARSGKCSPMKQTGTTVLNEEIPDVELRIPDTIIPGGEETTTTTKEKDSVGIYRRACGSKTDGSIGTDPRTGQKIICSQAPAGQEPVEKETVTTTTKKPDQTKPGEKANLYMYDMGDAISSYGQRLKTRGMLQGDRKAGKLARKAYDSMTDEERAKALGISQYSSEFDKIKNKRQFGRAIRAKEAAKSFKAQQELNESQRKANEQAVTTGRTDTVKLRARKVKPQDLSTTKQEDIFYKTNTVEKEAEANKKQNDAAAVEAAKKAENDKKRQNARAAGNMKYEKPSMLKMKGAFKMSGYGSKMLKK